MNNDYDIRECTKFNDIKMKKIFYKDSKYTGEQKIIIECEGYKSICIYIDADGILEYTTIDNKKDDKNE